MKWQKDRHAPIPDYHSTNGRWRAYRSTCDQCWILQDKTIPLPSAWPDNPRNVAYVGSLAEAKTEAATREMKKEDTTTTASETRAVDLLKRAQRELAAFRKLKEIAEAERDELLAALREIHDISGNDSLKMMIRVKAITQDALRDVLKVRSPRKDGTQ